MCFYFQVHTFVPTSRKTYNDLPEGIEKFFVADVTKLVSNKVPGFRESELRYLTFLYTCPLTTLFGMQSAMMPNRTHEATTWHCHVKQPTDAVIRVGDHHGVN